MSCLYSAAVAVFLLSALPWGSAMSSVERTNGAMLLGIVLGSAFTAYSLRKAPVAARYTASALGLLGAVLLARDLAGAAGISWDENPALVIANTLVLSLWSSLFFSMVLVASCASHPAAAPAEPRESAV